MPTKQVKLAIITSGADNALKSMTALAAGKKDLGDKPVTVRMNLDGAKVTDDELSALRLKIKEITDKGAIVRVNIAGGTGDIAKVTAETDALSASGARVSTTMKDAEEKTTSFGSKAESAMSGMGMVLGMVGVGAIASLGGLVKSGTEAQQVETTLANAIKNTGGSWDDSKDKVEAVAESMSKYGYSVSDVESAMTPLVTATGSVSTAESMMGTAANYAAAKHVSLASAVGVLTKAAGGQMRSLKQLGLTQVTGATQAAAMDKAQTTLADQISSAGGMAAYAASKHMSLAQAEKLVAGATGQSASADDELAKKGLTLASATTLVTDASNGNSAALKKLAGMHLTLAQAQKLVSGASSGNIKDMNQLGLVVLPTTASSTQRLSQIQGILGEKYGGAAAANAKTFNGEMGALHANFSNLAEKLGMAVLPDLTALLGVINKFLGNKTALMITGGVLLAIAAGFTAIAVQAAIAAVAENLALFGIPALIALVIAGVILLVKNWEKVKPVVAPIAAVFVHMGVDVLIALKAITDAVLTLVGAIINGMAKAFGWVPGIGPKLKGAATQFNNFHKTVDDGFSKSITTMQGWAAELDNVKSRTGTVTQAIVADFGQQGVSTSQAKKDLDTYTSSIQKNGAGSAAAQPSRQQMIQDIESTGKNSQAANAQVNAYTIQITENKIQSDNGKMSRQQVITDLTNSGMSAKTAGKYADNYTASLKAIPANERTNMTLSATGTWSVTESAADKTFKADYGNPGGSMYSYALGGVIPGYQPGVDTVPIMASAGEGMIVPEAVRGLGGAPAINAINHHFAGHRGAGMSRGGIVDHFANGGVLKLPGGIGPGATIQDDWIATHQLDQTTIQNEAWATVVADIKSAKAAQAAAKAAGGAAGSAAGGSGPVKALAQTMAAAKGWTGSLWADLNSVEMAEAGWNLTATNPSSGAYGIAQGITGPSWYATEGGNSNTAAGQITAFLNYIAQRYGTPAGAWAHEQSDHWYANGGIIPEPVTGLGLHSGNQYHFAENGPELVMPASGSNASGAGVTNINIKVDAGDCVDPNAVAKSIHEKLRRYRTKKGNQPLGLG
jgi:hypothetical protein